MMPAGEYYVGDLCYVMSSQWTEFCEITIAGNDVGDGEFTLKNGVRFASYSTAFGDGRYYDKEGREYSVDAGLIGCILVTDISDPKADFTGGNIITFDEDFETDEHNGNICFGEITITTNLEEPEEEEENQYDEEDN